MSDNQHGNGSDNPNGDDAPKYVTPEALNSAIVGHLSRFEKKLAPQFDAIASRIVEQLRPAPAVEDDDADEDATAAPSGAPDDMAAKLSRRLDRERAEWRKRMEKLEREREEERSKARDAQMRQAVRDQLIEAGVDPARVKQALTWVVEGERRIQYSEDGSLTYRDDDGVPVSLSEGLSSWAKTDDAKVFLPPRNLQGSGDRPASNAGAQSNDRAAQRQALILKEMLGG
jgi:hypothetical protein